MEYLYSHYRVEIDQIGKSEWSELLQHFDDASLYQTWSYGAIRWGEKNLSHVLLKQNDDVVAMAQVAILKVPFLGLGIAYVAWGPIWRRYEKEIKNDHFHNMIRVLKEEYALRRRFFLRVFPNEIDGYSAPIISAFEKECYRRKPRPNRTILIDLSSPIEDLRQNLRRQWRQNLKKAQANNLEIVEGTSEELYRVALAIYKEMHLRKRFAEFTDMQALIPIQNDLPEELKMKILICYHKAKAIAALTWSEIGQTGLALVSATGSLALETKAAYLLWWKMIQLMKNHGCRYCDAGGINPGRNPGGYQFKSGLAKKQGKDVVYVGQFDLCKNIKSRVFIMFGESLRSFYRSSKRRFKART